MTYSEGHFSREEVAIIGMAGRFPDAPDIDTFWRNLRDGLSSIRSFSVDELRASGFDEAMLNNPAFVNAGAAIEDADCFDATFFGFSPFEAEIIDPQQRLFLECAWQALEDAGYDPERYDGAIGVFGSVSPNTYFQNCLIPNPEILKKAGSQLIRLSNEKDHVCTRVAFKLNLKGPAISINTACSSTGVALHLACQSVLSGECDMALVGGVRLEAPLKSGYLYEEGGILSPDGKCRAFDADARGTVFGNGVGMILIKRLSDAFQAGDNIHAVIKGTAINNDGSQKVGYSVPSVKGQAEVIEEALAMAEVSPDSIGYVEAHGTGTSLGDPIEIAALTKAYRKGTEKTSYCPIGSVKTNIGHLFAGAGIAGIIKAILVLKHKQIPSSLNFKNPNPQIDFSHSPFYVNDTLMEWKDKGHPRRVGVSSFGVGGTNAHIVLEEAPYTEPTGTGRSEHLLVLSTKTETALDSATAKLTEYLRANPTVNIADVTYTLQNGRKEFNHRRILVAGNIKDAIDALESRSAQQVKTYHAEPSGHDVVFMFSGQGAQYANMGKGLYEGEPLYRQSVDCSAQILKNHLGQDLREIMFPPQNKVEQASEQLKNTRITQPALFTLEYALAQLWISWGVRPTALLGHSIGEYVAACLAGVFSLEDALELIAVRGHLISRLPGGSMLAVSMSENDIVPFVDDEISLAAVNGPELCVVSGEVEAVRALVRKLHQSEVDYRYLHTSHAFHSHMMDAVMDEFYARLRKVHFEPPRIPIVSTVTGKQVSADEIQNPEYWLKNLRQPVRFSDGLEELMKVPDRIFLEVGPGRTLSTLAQQHTARLKEHIILSSIPHPYENQSDFGFILNTLGRMWLAGLSVDWSGYYGNERRQRISLPTYPFERRRYWVEPSKASHILAAPPQAASKKASIDDWFYLPSWKRLPPCGAGSKLKLFGRHSAWLVFADRSIFSAELVRRLKQKGHRVNTVEIGTKFGEVGEGAYSLNPRNETDYQKLMQQLCRLNAIPDIILHCWTLTNKPGLQSHESRASYLTPGFTSLLFLAKSIGNHIPDHSIDIKILTNNLHDVTGKEEIVAEKALIIGPCLVIPQEYRNVRCTNIDISCEPSKIQLKDQWLDKLLNDLKEVNPDPVVAYRGKHRWAKHYERIHLEAAPAVNTRLRKNGVYLITGGLGGIGLEIAEFLAQKVCAKLALVARTPIPDHRQWDQWLQTHHESDDTSRKICRIQKIQSTGADVLTISADVSDMNQMMAAKSRIDEKFGRIHGIIHAAGVAGGGMIQLKTVEAAERVLAPKVKGTLNLDRLFNSVPLDFFVLCSSISAVRGLTGQVDYCAANAFLDAYAHQSSSKRHVMSINWGMWQTVGMGVKTSIPDDLKPERKEQLEFGIEPEEGQQAFARILENSFPQIIASPQDFSNPPLVNRKEPSLRIEDKPAKTAKNEATHIRPNLSSVYVVPGNPTEQSISEIWQELLGIEKIGIHDNFFELGGHSILGTQLIERMRAAFSVKIPLSTLFEKPTVHSLSQMILEEKGKAPSFVQSKNRGQKRRERRLNR
jgi:acyl transferase domain-containing protein/acyl carrier protein